jgi:hypothetical protein
MRKNVLDRIVAGDVDLAFRRWVRPTVKAGGTLRTQAGMLRIDSVTPCDLDDITEDDARRAGIELGELRAFLESKPDGDVYRVVLGGFVTDPRETLRKDDQLSDQAFADVVERLHRLDRSSRHGQWTHTVLALIAEKPHVRAQDLADSLGLEKMVFKNDVTKLKALGLTISHSPGYELSPRGHEVLKRLDGRT